MNKLAVNIFLVLLTIPYSEAQENYGSLLNTMISNVEKMVIDTQEDTGIDELDDGVIEAIKKVPRHQFLPSIYKNYAYENRPLPIGKNQTITKPYIIYLMLHLAKISKDSIVLEVGTGSGYQAAISAQLARHVYTIEIIESLGRNAQKVLHKLGYKNITVQIGDGYNGWSEHAPFDVIIVTASSEKIPQPLINQLKPGGRLIMPLGAQTHIQSLQILVKDQDGKLSKRDVLPVSFSPLTREN